MNQLNAVIKTIESEDNTLLVMAQAAGITFSMLATHTPDKADYLQEGKAIIVTFEETAVSIAKQVSGQLSIRNRIPCTVSALLTGNVLTRVSLDCKGHTFTSVITTHAVKELNLQTGDQVEALIKTNDITLSQPEM